MCYGGVLEKQTHMESIAKIMTPQMDPVGGKEGPLKDHWKLE